LTNNGNNGILKKDYIEKTVSLYNQRRIQMTRKKAITLGIFTVIPFFYIIVFVIFFIGIATSINNNRPSTIDMFFIIFPIHFAVMIDTIVLLVIYIKDVFKNQNIEESKRTLWALVLFFGNLIAMPIYWYTNIWKKIKKEDIKM
jgi:hypothetical protein